MALQNRVDPTGKICFTPYRGRLMGNRGCLHNSKQEIVRPYKVKAWIYCELEYKGWHRPVMQPGKYTELFFLDEATALAAGHRPCGLCKRPALKAFKSLWKKANHREGLTLTEIDQLLHQERIQREYPILRMTKDLPDGILFSINSIYYLKQGVHLWPWSFAGYGKPVPISEFEQGQLITPPSIVKAIQEGFTVQPFSR